MSWGDVEKGNKQGGSGVIGRFVSFKDKERVLLRVLDEQPHTIQMHKVSMEVNGENKFRTIQATESPDDNYILATAGNRFPAVSQYNIRAYEYDEDHEDGGEVRILQGGVQIFKALKKLFDDFGHLNQFDIVISKEGTGRDTEYTVSAAPRSRELDVEAITAAMLEDEALAWENVYSPITGEEQRQILEDAEIDITYDPVAALASGMEFDHAKGQTFTFGKYKGKTVQEMLVIDAGYVDWAGKNVTSNDALAAACRVAADHVRQLGDGNVKKGAKLLASGSAPAPAAAPAPARTAKAAGTASEPQKKAAAPAPAAAPPKAATKPAAAAAQKPAANNEEHTNLVKEITAVFNNDDRFGDAQEIVAVVKKHGNGKTRVRDLNVEQLTALKADIEG